MTATAPQVTTVNTAAAAPVADPFKIALVKAIPCSLD
jgi:hypothetical protein